MPLKHAFARLGRDIQPINRMCHPGDDSQSRRARPERPGVHRPEGLERSMLEARDQRRTELDIQRQESQGSERGVGEEDGELASLEVAKHLSRDCHASKGIEVRPGTKGGGCEQAYEF